MVLVSVGRNDVPTQQWSSSVERPGGPLCEQQPHTVSTVAVSVFDSHLQLVGVC